MSLSSRGSRVASLNFSDISRIAHVTKSQVLLLENNSTLSASHRQSEVLDIALRSKNDAVLKHSPMSFLFYDILEVVLYLASIQGLHLQL